MGNGECEGFNLSENESLCYSDLSFGFLKRLRVCVKNKEKVDVSIRPYFENSNNSFFKVIKGVGLTRKKQVKISSEVSILPNETYEFDIKVVREKGKKFSASSRESNKFCLEVKIPGSNPVIVLSKKVEEVGHKWASTNRNKRVVGSGSRKILNPYYKKKSSEESKQTVGINCGLVKSPLETAKTPSKMLADANDSIKDLEVIAKKVLADLFVSSNKNPVLCRDKKINGDDQRSYEPPKSELVIKGYEVPTEDFMKVDILPLDETVRSHPQNYHLSENIEFDCESIQHSTISSESFFSNTVHTKNSWMVHTKNSRTVITKHFSQNVSFPYPPSRTLAGSTSQSGLPECQQRSANMSDITQSRIRTLNNYRFSILDSLSKKLVSEADALETLGIIAKEIDSLYSKQ